MALSFQYPGQGRTESSRKLWWAKEPNSDTRSVSSSRRDRIRRTWQDGLLKEGNKKNPNDPKAGELNQVLPKSREEESPGNQGQLWLPARTEPVGQKTEECCKVREQHRQIQP